VRYHGPGGVEVIHYDSDVPIPHLKPGHILVKNIIAGVNFIDIYHRTGAYKIEEYPFIPGRDGAGIIEAIGEEEGNKHGLKVGDRVAYSGPGTYAEYSLVEIKMTFKLPNSVSFEQGATGMVQGLTAHALVTSSYPVKPNDTVLVQAAAGGLGQIVVQMAKIKGSRVIGTTSNEEKASIAKACGCDEVIIYTKQNVVEEVRRLTGGKGVQVVYDGVGKATFNQSLDCLAIRGFLVNCGNASGKPDPIDPAILMAKGSLSLTRPSLMHFLLTREEFLLRATEVFNWVEQQHLKFNFNQPVPLKDAGIVQKMLEEGKTTGKILLAP